MNRRLTCLGLLCLAGCGTLGATLQGIESPDVSITDLGIKQLGIMEQLLSVKLSIRNPNDRELAVRGARFELAVAGIALGTGLSNAGVTVPALGSAVLPAELGLSTLQFVRQLQILDGTSSGAKSLDYALTGSLFLADAVGTRVPFSNEGTIALPAGGLPGA